MRAELVTSLEVFNVLGEGVVWDHRSQTVLWTDIESSLLYRWSFGKEVTHLPLPERLGSFALTPDPNRLICAFESGFALLNCTTGDVQWIEKIQDMHQENRLNDGRVDRQGRFWSGSMNEVTHDDSGVLYRLDDKGAKPILHNIRISNGLCWNNAGDIMYFADSPTRTIQKFDFYQTTGTVSSPTVFAETAPEAYPDGACIDALDQLWSAQWGARRVQCYSPQGEPLLEIELPCPQPSCVAFGGPDMRHLFVTTARAGLSAEQLDKYPQSGNLFIFETNIQGVHEEICTFDYADLSQQ